MNEHPVQQPIDIVQVDAIPGQESQYRVGFGNVTRIEACEKSGQFSMIPYVRVWAGEECVAEFCQHNIVGIYFGPAEPPPPPPPGEGKCPFCAQPLAECDCIPF